MIELIRVSYNAYGTFGVLLKDGVPMCVTLEDPWNYNKKNISCVPTGSYECIPHNGHRYKDTWVLKGVPKRTAILFHIGNTQKDTEGCILVGQRFGTLDEQPAILGSKPAMAILREVLPNSFKITIKDGTIEGKKPNWLERILESLKENMK